jgi:hypothetical protein
MAEKNLLKNFVSKMNARSIALAKLIAIDPVHAKALIERRGEDLKTTAKRAEGLQVNVEEARA